MKTAILFDKKNGNIISNCRISEIYEEVDYIIVDIPSDKEVIRIEDGQPIFDDSKEVKEIKQKIIELNVEMNKLKLELLKEIGGVLNDRD